MEKIFKIIDDILLLLFSNKNKELDKPIPKKTIIPKESRKIRWLYPKAKFIKDPDGGKRLFNTPNNKPLGVVIHHTVTYNIEQTIKMFKTNVVDVHFLIDHDGSIVQMVECNRTAAHAGISKWNGVEHLNNYYLGIEVINLGPLIKKNNKFYDAYGKLYTGKVRTRSVEGYDYWEPFSEEQEQSLITLCQWLKDEYNINKSNFAGHFEVSPKRKNDPAGGMKDYPLDVFRDKLK